MSEGHNVGFEGRAVFLDESIPTRISVKDQVVADLLSTLTKNGWIDGDDCLRVRMALDEAITNAMVHGNKMDPGKVVRIRAFADGDKWGVTIQDEGDGFSDDDVPDPEDPDNFMREGGRGILMMRGFMDEVHFLGKGNCVLMVRKRSTGGDARRERTDSKEA